MGRYLEVPGANYASIAIGKVTPITGKTKITVVASPANGGSVSGGGSYNEGEQIQLTATPTFNSTFTKWSDNVATATRNVIVGSEDKTYTAEFNVLSGSKTINDTDINTNKVENAKYANNKNGDFFYYDSTNSLSTQTLSYIIPYKLKVGSAVTIKFKTTAPKNSSNLYGTLHDFKNVPSDLSSAKLLNSDYGIYSNLTYSESRTCTYTIREGYQYVDIYLFTTSAATLTPSDITNAIESITIELE